MKRPRFELSRVYEDGTQDSPEIVPVTAMPWDTRMSRRGFLGTSLTAAAVLGVVGTGCTSLKPGYNRNAKIERKNKQGKTIAEVLPCGSPIPPGATCTCN